MKQPSSWAAAYVTPLFVLLVTTAVLMTGVSDAWAYNTYSTDGETGNCANCHGDFRTSPYISLVDGVDWENSLHNVHRNGMLGGDCATCHAASGFSPVSLESSEGGNGLEAISCVGCHGRQADEDSPSAGWGAGLRQHHVGEANCSGCHDDQTGYTPVGENVLPNYYANPGSGHPDIPMDSCNPDGTESLDFSGTALGLDNDGDSLYDGNDPDCPVLCQSDAFCDNGQFCDGAETCDLGTGECVVGTPVDPDDGVGCTDDSCDEANDVVVNAPNDGLCDNGQFCDGSETCDAVNDCQAGTPLGVDDGVGCTDDSCDEANDVVVNAPNDGLCDNGQFCDGSETCDAVSDCQAGTPPVVDDGVGCTDDSCDEANDVVVNTPNDGLCDNGEFCDGSETCDATEDCQAGTAPCDPATETCDEVGDICEAIGCTSDAECDNGMFCDGSETCNTGTGECLPGTPVDVDDGVGCTDDSCDEANDVVVNAPNDGLCDNGEFCDGSETCDATEDCQAGTAPCDPATETCDEAVNMCEPIEMLDLDVASLKVTKRVSLQRVKPIGITLGVKNNGTVEGTAFATITGMQNGIEVYNETLTVTDAVGNGRTKYNDRSVPSIPTFEPRFEGDILWRVTIADTDPDNDAVTAVTTVVP